MDMKLVEDKLGGNETHDGNLIIKSLNWIILAFLLLGGLLFGCAGRLDWGSGWVFMITMIACVAINFAILLRTNPEVIEERSHLNRGAKKWDIVITSVATIFILATLAVAGLDQRYGWSGSVSSGWHYAGIMLFVVGDLFFLWAMAVNRYFSKLVRIQTERGHKVVTSGPYRIVRHPGYLGWSVMWAESPLIFDSPWAFIPAVLSIILIVIRTALEDSTLQRELPGYSEYVSRVGYKLVPWVW
ncbi:MAG: isoprenylcysteine carboxylmethyltransferase family protein [Thermodesulfobacteriota bacterium]